MPRLEPWMIDAIDLDLPESVEDFRKQLLHENSEISDFLIRSPEERDFKFLVVAPKGYGKTLLLKAKRIALQRVSPEMLFIPQGGSLIDRPPGTPPLFTKEEIDRKSSDIQYWKTLWITSICLSVLQHVDRSALTHIDSDFTRELVNSPVLSTVGDVFNSLLHLTDAQYFRTTNACLAAIIPYYRSIRRSVATFIDNVDDYFYPQLPVEDEVGAIYKNQNRQVWVLAQIGLAEAIRELRETNLHIKLFAALRSEALLRGFRNHSKCRANFWNIR